MLDVDGARTGWSRCCGAVLAKVWSGGVTLSGLEVLQGRGRRRAGRRQAVDRRLSVVTRRTGLGTQIKETFQLEPLVSES